MLANNNSLRLGLFCEFQTILSPQWLLHWWGSVVSWLYFLWIIASLGLILSFEKWEFWGFFVFVFVFFWPMFLLLLWKRKVSEDLTLPFQKQFHYSWFLYIVNPLQYGSMGRVHLECRRHRRCSFNPWVKKIPWRRKWQLIPVLLPEKSHGQRSLVGYSPKGPKESDVTELLRSPPFSEVLLSAVLLIVKLQSENIT